MADDVRQQRWRLSALGAVGTTARLGDAPVTIW